MLTQYADVPERVTEIMLVDSKSYVAEPRVLTVWYGPVAYSTVTHHAQKACSADEATSLHLVLELWHWKGRREASDLQ